MTLAPEAAVTFLREAARYFGNRPTGGEDAAFWANTANADACNDIAKLIEGEKKMTNPKYMRPGLDFARGKAIEELGELQAALGKSLRWGWESANPELPMHQRETNIVWVQREMKDVRDALDNLDKEIDEELGDKR